MKLEFAVLMCFLTGTSYGFSLKTECLIDFMPSEEMLEGEQEEGALPFVGGAWASHVGGHHMMDSEDWQERMGLGEMEENEGQMFQTPHYGSTGYMDEEGEMEDAKRRRRKRRRRRRRRRQTFGAYRSSIYRPRSQHTPDALVGALRCPTDSVIHLLNVTIGFSNTWACQQAYPGCQAQSAAAKQIIHCQGVAGTCGVNLRRRYMLHCRNMMNFARIQYECVPATRKIDICDEKNSDEYGSVVMTSPSYPLGPAPTQSPGTGEFLTCECTLRAMAGSKFEMEYLRTHLPGQAGTCDGDMLLLETPDPAKEGRYLLESELCGVNSSSHVIIQDHILRVTFLGGSPLAGVKAGFLVKFRAVSTNGSHDLYHVSCAGSPLTPAAISSHPLPASPGTTATTTRQEYINRLLDWMKSTGRAPPANFDPSRLPANFFNMSRSQLQAQMVQFAQTQSRVSGPLDPPPGVAGGLGGGGGVEVQEDEPVQSSSPGVLSGVVASLASVIVIMGSIGVFFWHRRYQKKQQQTREELYNSVSGGSEPWYASDVMGNQPDGGHSSGATHATSSANTHHGDTLLVHPRTNARAGPSVYCIATGIPVEEDTASSAGPDNPPQVPSVTEIASSTNQSASNQIALAPPAGPVAPPRRKRNAGGQSASDVYSCSHNSPYDNALPIRVAKKPSTTPTQTASSYSDSNDKLCEKKEDDSYSTIEDMQHALRGDTDIQHYV